MFRDLCAQLPSFAPDVWSRLTVAGGAHYDPWWAPVLLLELAVNILLVVFSALVAVLYVRRRTSLPRAYIAFFWASLAVRVVDQWAAAVIPGGGGDGGVAEWAIIARDAIAISLWTTYFLVSRRVKATFVERLHAAPSAPAAEPAAPTMTEPEVLPTAEPPAPALPGDALAPGA